LISVRLSPAFSRISRTAMPFLRTPVARQALAAARPRFAPAGVRMMTGGATRHGNDPEVLEKGKQSVLRKHSKDSTEDPHWHEEIASDAEAFVKAQRGEIDSSADAIAKLQQQTKDAAEKKQK